LPRRGFPAKPLALIAGKPLIQRVVEQCQKAKSLPSHRGHGRHAHLGSGAEFLPRGDDAPDIPSGSDRIAEVAERCECDAVVNIQGDEPLIEPVVIDAVAGALAQNEMSTAATRIKNPAELDNPNVVKVVVNAAGRALYFSRRTIPYLREAASGSERTVGGVSFFEASRHLRLPARDAVAAGEISRCRRWKTRRSWSSCARWKTASDRGRAGGLRQRRRGRAGRRVLSGWAFSGGILIFEKSLK
jgi:CTP:molybdopterin cytidylyltransferase MocA